MRSTIWILATVVLLTGYGVCSAQKADERESFQPPAISSSWDDLTAGLKTEEDWRVRRPLLKQRFLDLIRDQHKPQKPPLELQVHESVIVEGTYTRKLISYNVEADERAYAYLGIPQQLAGKAPAIVALHGTYAQGTKQAAGLVDDPDHIGALGHSLGGHGTIFLAAYDQRVKAAACNCGGSFFRHNPRVEAWARDHWYVYFQHIRPGLIEGQLPPIDFHEIIALIAPRAFLDLSGLNDGIPGTQRQRVLMLTRIMDIYELEKAPQNFAFFVHGRGHSVAHESRQLMYGWMDTHLKPPEATKTRLVTQ